MGLPKMPVQLPANRVNEFIEPSVLFAGEVNLFQAWQGDSKEENLHQGRLHFCPCRLKSTGLDSPLHLPDLQL